MGLKYTIGRTFVVDEETNRVVGIADPSAPGDSIQYLGVADQSDPITRINELVSANFGKSLNLDPTDGLQIGGAAPNAEQLEKIRAGMGLTPRQIVSVDLPPIDAGATAATTASVTGARTGALLDATSVLCAPPASFVSAGLLLLNCYPSANDEVTLVVNNPTAGSVDLGADNFAFWVVR